MCSTLIDFQVKRPNIPDFEKLAFYAVRVLSGAPADDQVVADGREKRNQETIIVMSKAHVRNITPISIVSS